MARPIVDGGPTGTAGVTGNGGSTGGGRAGRDGGDASSPDMLVSIAIDPPEATLVIDTRTALTVTGKRADGSTVNLSQNATFDSSNSAVVNVLGGSAYAAGVGAATITATYGMWTAVAKISVKDKTLVSLTTYGTNTLQLDELGRVNIVPVSALYDNMTEEDVTTLVSWTSSDTGVVWTSGIPADSFVVLGPGTAVLTAALDGATTTVTITVSSVPSLTGASIAGVKPLLHPTETRPVQLSLFYSNGEVFTLTQLPWVSSNPLAVSVSGDGIVEARATGTSTISAVLGGKMVASALITVGNVTLQSLMVGPANLTVPFPDPVVATATAVYSDGSMFDVSGVASWQSDPDLELVPALAGAAFLAIGRVGTFHISASLDGVTGSAPVTVPFGAPSAIELEAPPDLIVSIPDALVAYALYAGDNRLEVTSVLTWSVDDSTIVTVGADGLVQPLKPGSTQLHASYPGFTIAPVPVKVTSTVILTIDISPPHSSMHADDSPQSFFASATLDDGEIMDVTANAVWSTTNPQVATVSNAAGTIGLVTPVMEGMTAVRATLAGVTGSTVLTVTPPLPHP